MEATPEQSAEGLLIVRVLSAVLDRLVCANAAIARADPGQVTKFHAMKAPAIGIQQYLERIHKYASCSNECFILALIYIDRLIQRNNFLLTELNVHRVVITSILLAAKFFDDAYYNNAYYAKVGGVLVSEMNGLEVDFLFRINFSLHVTTDVFQKYRAELLSQAGVLSIQAALSVDVPVPIQAPQPMPQAPVLHHAPSAMTGLQYSNHSEAVHHTQNQCHHGAAHITPSPPAEAGRIINDLLKVTVQQHQQAIVMAEQAKMYVEYVFPGHRPCSDPINKIPCYRSQPSSSFRCSQKSFSAPPIAGVPVGFPLQEPYLVIDQSIYSTHSGLIHYHHGDFTQHGPSEGIDFSVMSNRMLAGLGAGM